MNDRRLTLEIREDGPLWVEVRIRVESTRQFELSWAKQAWMVRQKRSRNTASFVARR